MAKATPPRRVKRALLIWLLGILVALLAACTAAQGDLDSSPTAPADPTLPTPTTETAPRQPTPTTTPANSAAPPTPAPMATIPAGQATRTAAGEPGEPGALISLDMRGQAGLLLDDYPPAMRDRVASEALAQSEAAWRARAERQVALLKLRLNFRNFFQAGKGQLPLPPRELWDIQLDPGGPFRQEVQGHDLVVWPYTFSSTLLTDAESPGLVEPALAEVDGAWEEPFLLPVDPDMLLQRTGNACVNEAGFPPNSYDAENLFHFYDFDCTPDSVGATGCHRTVRPQLSCRQALEASVGSVETAVRFERLPWDEGLASQVRVSPLTSPDAPDLLVVGDDLNVNRVVYRYIETDDCAVEEGAVGGTGWRRLLQFDATLHNAGGAALHVGAVTSEDAEHHLFQYNACHDHFHHSNYGSFQLRDRDDVSASKQAFCVQSTSRYSNDESSPLWHDYTCSFQGIQAGWVDEYAAGLDVQWIDITDMDVPEEGRTVQLGFQSNREQFLCEGTPVLDEGGNPQWEATGQLSADGHAVERPQCDFIANWDANNFAERDVFVPQVGSHVTAPCPADQSGPFRNCGFAPVLPAETLACTPGATANLTVTLPSGAAPHVLRVCERSDALGTGVACAYSAAVANVVLGMGNNEVSFTCPALRDGDPGAGGYALYSAPAWPADAHEEVVVAGQESAADDN